MPSQGASAPRAPASGASASPTNANASGSKGSARVAASRANGAKSRGPKTAEGKARSSRNALRHGLCASRHLLLHDEHPSELAALETALIEDLAPQGALQEILAARIASAAWRMARADRMEAEILDERGSRARGAPVCPGLALVRDGNGPRAFETLLRYRGALLAELLRSLKALKALQAEAARATTPVGGRAAPGSRSAPVPDLEGNRTRHAARGSGLVAVEPRAPQRDERHPNEPETRRDPGASRRAGQLDETEPRHRPGRRSHGRDVNQRASEPCRRSGAESCGLGRRRTARLVGDSQASASAMEDVADRRSRSCPGARCRG